MLRLVNQSFKVASRSSNTFHAPIQRCFSEKLDIPTDREQQGGRRRKELEAEDEGFVGFNRDPIIPPVDAGSKQNPILVRTICVLLVSLN
jgi:hypothetical protein